MAKLPKLFPQLLLILVYVSILAFTPTYSKPSRKPNIIFVLTDDQDEVLQSLKSMPKLQRLISDRGVRFPNMYVTTPVCCPSRSAILTGRFAHNNGALTNTVKGGCSTIDWQRREESRTFPNLLHKAGYKTFYAGKYLNQYGYPNTGGAEHIPPGWDWWNGHIDRSTLNYYYNYNISINGSNVYHGNKLSDYLTTIISEQVMEFLKFTTPTQPFFMMICPTAAHAPFTPLPEYDGNFTHKFAPRTPNYNVYTGDKHWMVRVQPKSGMTQAVMDKVDEFFRDRWRTLQSVDQMIEDIIIYLKRQRSMDDTIFIYSADNGFHLGQFVMPVDKRQPYEFDVKVPMILAGPGIAKGAVRYETIQSIDIAPTILEYAGVQVPSSDWLDGRSIVSLTAIDPIMSKQDISWRNQFLIEHWGDHGPGSVEAPKTTCIVEDECFIIDTANNTYSCIRRMGQYNQHYKNDIYCEFADNDNFREYFDLSKDKWQLRNTVKELDLHDLMILREQLQALMRCKGGGCRTADVGIEQ